MQGICIAQRVLTVEQVGSKVSSPSTLSQVGSPGEGFRPWLVQGSAQAAVEWASVHPPVMHQKWRISSRRNIMARSRLQRHFKDFVGSTLVLQGLELLCTCKSGPWDFCGSPFPFKTMISVPIFRRPFRFWGSQSETSLNTSEVNFQQRLQKNLNASPRSFRFVWLSIAS